MVETTVLMSLVCLQTSAAAHSPVALAARLKNIAETPFQDWRLSKSSGQVTHPREFHLVCQL